MSVQTPYARGERARPIVFPLLLILVGATFLLVNLGYVSWDTVRWAWQFWPVIFIALGIEALITRRAPWGALVLAIILTAILSSHGWMRPPSWRQQPATAPRATTLQNQTLNGASRAVVSVTAGGTNVSLGALKEPGVLARWQGTESDAPSYRVRDGVGRLDLELAHGRGFPGFLNLSPFGSGPSAAESAPVSVQLAAGVPLEIEARLGATDATIDLRELQVTRLALDAGASSGTVYLPSLADSASITIRGGASNLEIVVPEGVRARITSEGGLSSLRVDPARFRQVDESGTVYESQSADPGAHSLDVTLRLGASSVSVR